MSQKQKTIKFIPISKILAMYKKGVTCTNIAQQCGTYGAIITGILRTAGIRIRTRSEISSAPRLKGKWARKYDACIDCGGTDKKHVGKGLCCNCYQLRIVVEKRGYTCEYKAGKRIFNQEHKAKLSKAAYKRHNKKDSHDS